MKKMYFLLKLLLLLFEKKKGILSSFLVYTQFPEQNWRTVRTRKYLPKEFIRRCFRNWNRSSHSLYYSDSLQADHRRLACTVPLRLGIYTSTKLLMLPKTSKRKGTSVLPPRQKNKFLTYCYRNNCNLIYCHKCLC